MLVYNNQKGNDKLITGLEIYDALYGNFPKMLEFSLELFEISNKKYLNQAINAKIAHAVADAYYYVDSLEKSTQYLEYAAQQIPLRTTNDTVVLANILNDAGLNHRYSGDPYKAKNLLLRANNLMKSVKGYPGELSDIKSNLGVVFHDLGNFEAASQYFLEALEIDLHGWDNRRKSSSLNSLGRIYLDWGMPERALYYYRESARLLDAEKDMKALSLRFNNIGMVHQTTAQYDSAVFWFNKALNLEKQFADSLRLATRYANLGNAYLNSGNIKNARQYLNKAFRIFNKTGNNAQKSIIFGHMANLLLAQGQHKAAEKKLALAMEYAREASIKERAGIHKQMYDFYKKTGNFQEALRFLESCKILNDSIFNLNAAEQVQRLETFYQSKQKEAEIVRLEAQNEIQQQRVAFNKKQRDRAILVSIILLAFLVLLLHLFSKLRARKKDLALKNQELFTLNTTLNQLFEIISHDLKNATATYQSSADIIEYHLKNEEPEKLKPLTGEIRKNASQLSEMLTNLLEWARSQKAGDNIEIHRINLKQEIDKILALFDSRAKEKNNAVIFDCNENTEALCNRDSFGIIMRNLISNALKFTENGIVRVSVNTLTSSVVRISVADSGCGIPDYLKEDLFNAGKQKVRPGTRGEKGTGLGLMAVADNLRQNNGTIEWLTPETGGTEFYVNLNRQ